MARDVFRPRESFCLDKPKHRNGGSQNCRLSVFSQLQFVSRAIKAQAGDKSAKRIVSFFKDLAGGRKVLRQLLTHARVLRSLSGKDIRNCRLPIADCQLFSISFSTASDPANQSQKPTQTIGNWKLAIEK